MTSFAWDGLITYARFSDASANSEAFVMPKAVGSVTFFIGALDGVSTVKVQALDPQDKTTWRDVFSFDPGDGTMTLVGAMPESQCTVVPASALGTGVFRLVASNAQPTASVHAILIDRIVVS